MKFGDDLMEFSWIIWKKMVMDDGEDVSRPREYLEGLKAKFLKYGGVWGVVLFIEKG